MSWPLTGAETISALVALCGMLLPILWSRHQTRTQALADKAVAAQAEAMQNKDQEISGWQRRYEQERTEHREDNQRNQDRIDHLEDRLYSKGGRS